MFPEYQAPKGIMVLNYLTHTAYDATGSTAPYVPYLMHILLRTVTLIFAIAINLIKSSRLAE